MSRFRPHHPAHVTSGAKRPAGTPRFVYELQPGQHAWVMAPFVGLGLDGVPWIYLGARTYEQRRRENGDVLVECGLDGRRLVYDITVPHGATLARSAPFTPCAPIRHIFMHRLLHGRRDITQGVGV